MVEAYRRARTQNRSEHNKTKGTAGERGNINSRAEGHGQTRDAGNDEGQGKMQGVDKMDP